MGRGLVFRACFFALVLAVLATTAAAQPAPGPPAVGVVRGKARTDHPDQRIHRPDPVDRAGRTGRPRHRVSRKAAVCRGCRGQKGRSPLSPRTAAVSGAGRFQQGQCRAVGGAAPQRRADARTRAVSAARPSPASNRTSMRRSPRSARWRRRSPAPRRSCRRPRSISAIPRSAPRSTAGSAPPR